MVQVTPVTGILNALRFFLQNASSVLNVVDISHNTFSHLLFRFPDPLIVDEK